MDKLIYNPDSGPGYERRRKGKGFCYYYRKKRIKNKKKIAWIKSLKIPPAWEDVWIATKKNSHLLATGRDKKGRKQYIYHERWVEVHKQKKFDNLFEFGKNLPKIRRTVEKNLQQKKLSKKKVISAIIRIMDETHLRIGNERYAEINHSYGITTLRRKHIDLLGEDVKIEFTGKSGIKRQVLIHDKEIADFIRNLVHIPGYEVFKYYDNGIKKNIESIKVNEFLEKITGNHFTSKDFRTWAGTRYAAEFFLKEKKNKKKKRIKEVVEKVSNVLGNTPAIAKEYYIHPKIIEAYEKEHIYRARPFFKQEKMLDPVERIVLSVIK
ncbi:DNA topoisomerase IB [Candidatus Woesearchaeota archaeon]|nr:DNA topoisomerase IB [Candidatus Woesearchaeota archaeon]